MVDTLLIGIDISNKDSTAVLTVGKKRMNQSVEIINAFQGDEARELYNRLVTKEDRKPEYADQSAMEYGA